MSAWRDQSTGQGFAMNGNDKSAYANAAAQIQSALDKGHQVDRGALEILEKAKYIGVAPSR